MCLQDFLLVSRVGGTLLAADKACSHLDALSTQCQSGDQSPSIGDAAGRHYRYPDTVHHLGHQSHGGGFTDMPSRLRPLGDQSINAGVFQSFG